MNAYLSATPVWFPVTITLAGLSGSPVLVKIGRRESLLKLRLTVEGPPKQKCCVSLWPSSDWILAFIRESAQADLPKSAAVYLTADGLASIRPARAPRSGEEFTLELPDEGRC